MLLGSGNQTLLEEAVSAILEYLEADVVTASSEELAMKMEELRAVVGLTNETVK